MMDTWRRFGGLMVAATVAVAMPKLVRAQDAATPPAARSSNELPSLGAAFPCLSWDAQVNGVLIAVAPADVTWRGSDDNTSKSGTGKSFEPPDDATLGPLIKPAVRYGLSASYVARHFSRKLIHTGSVCVFAPSKISLLNTDLKPVNPFVSLTTEDRMRRLEISLTPAQWKLLGSEDGLGVGDLSRTQEGLFENLIPAGSVVKKRVQNDESDVDAPSQPGPDFALKLSEAQRAGVRLRLERVASMYLVAENDMPEDIDAFHGNVVGSEELYLDLPNAASGNENSMYGQPLLLEVPNRLKPSDLDLKSPVMDETVSVIDAKTVGDLLADVRMATGVELYADGRLSALPVMLAGAEVRGVRAGDLLEALCWAMAATYRMVGPSLAGSQDCAFVLTYDRAGLGALHGRAEHWIEDGMKEEIACDVALDKQIGNQKPAQYLSFHKGNRLNPSPRALEELEGFDGSAQGTISVAALTPDQQKQMSAALSAVEPLESNSVSTASRHIRADKVCLSLGLSLSYLIPGVGDVVCEEPWADSVTRGARDAELRRAQADFKNNSRPIVGGPVIVAVAAPTDSQQLDEMVSTAADLGLKQIWIEAPLSGAGVTAGDYVTAGKAHGIGVGVTMAVLRSPESDADSDPERNIYGETMAEWADDMAQQEAAIDQAMSMLGLPVRPRSARRSRNGFLNPGLPAVEAQLEKRILATASTPGLAILALREATVPGYALNGETIYDNTAGEGFGYTKRDRLLFLRKYGYDPIDLDGSGNSSALLEDFIQLPFFDGPVSDPDSAGVPARPGAAGGQKWQAYRDQAEPVLWTALGAALHRRVPQLPLFLSASGSGEPERDDTYWSWDGAEPLPRPGRDDDLKKVSGTVRKHIVPLIYHHEDFDEARNRNESVPSDETEAGWVDHEMSRMLTLYWRHKTQKPQELILDLSSMPENEAIELVKDAFLPRQ